MTTLIDSFLLLLYYAYVFSTIYFMKNHTTSSYMYKSLRIIYFYYDIVNIEIIIDLITFRYSTITRRNILRNVRYKRSLIKKNVYLITNTFQYKIIN